MRWRDLEKLRKDMSRCRDSLPPVFLQEIGISAKSGEVERARRTRRPDLDYDGALYSYKLVSKPRWGQVTFVCGSTLTVAPRANLNLEPRETGETW